MRCHAILRRDGAVAVLAVTGVAEGGLRTIPGAVNARVLGAAAEKLGLRILADVEGPTVGARQTEV